MCPFPRDHKASDRRPISHYNKTCPINQPTSPWPRPRPPPRGSRGPGPMGAAPRPLERPWSCSRQRYSPGWAKHQFLFAFCINKIIDLPWVQIMTPHGRAYCSPLSLPATPLSLIWTPEGLLDLLTLTSILPRTLLSELKRYMNAALTSGLLQ